MFPYRFSNDPERGRVVIRRTEIHKLRSERLTKRDFAAFEFLGHESTLTYFPLDWRVRVGALSEKKGRPEGRPDGGGGGIRTPEAFWGRRAQHSRTPSGFKVRCFQPFSHPSTGILPRKLVVWVSEAVHTISCGNVPCNRVDLVIGALPIPLPLARHGMSQGSAGSY